MASIEGEMRWQFRGRWNAMAAAGYGTARSSNEFFTRTEDITSGAVGVRYLLADKSGMRAGLNVGYTSEATAVYIQVGNAWFRP